MPKDDNNTAAVQFKIKHFDIFLLV